MTAINLKRLLAAHLRALDQPTGDSNTRAPQIIRMTNLLIRVLTEIDSLTATESSTAPRPQRGRLFSRSLR